MPQVSFLAVFEETKAVIFVVSVYEKKIYCLKKCCATKGWKLAMIAGE